MEWDIRNDQPIYTQLIQQYQQRFALYKPETEICIIRKSVCRMTIKSCVRNFR